MRPQHIQFRIDQQLTQAQSISEAYQNLIVIGTTNLSRHRILTRLEALKDQWSIFATAHHAIMIALSRVAPSDNFDLLSNPYFTNNIYSTTYEAYLESLESMQVLLETHSNPPVGSSKPFIPEMTITSSRITTDGHSTRLPRINLPQFNGSLSEWLPFKDLFISLVLNNPTVSSVERMHYLKTSLCGSAASLLQNTPLTGDNFQKSWESLISYYDNRRILVNTALQNLFAIPPINSESSSALENLYTSVMQLYQTLESLNRPVHMWDDILIHLMVQKMDSESIRAWENHLGPTKEPPTWKQFKDFLYARITSLQAFQNSQKIQSPSASQGNQTHAPGPSRSAKVFNNTVDNLNVSCPLCSSDHPLFRCEQYLRQSLRDRKDFVFTKRLCFNCLRAHKVSDCLSTRRCIKCGRRHHTTLHLDLQKPSRSREHTSDTASVSQLSPLPTATNQ